MRISELAGKTGLSIDAIRFYEKKGLLDEAHVRRRSNNYRDYTDKAVERLRLIRQGKRLGFTLTEIQSEIEAWESNKLSVAEKVERLQQKITLINEQIESLARIKTYLLQKIDVVKSSRSEFISVGTNGQQPNPQERLTGE